jgi:hypothetical protein
MEISAGQFFKNPTGSGSGQVFKREGIREYMSNKAIELIKQKKIKLVQVFSTRDDSIFYVWIQVGSETLESFFHDVVLKFKPSSTTNTSFLSTYSFYGFSNSPAFMFTYAHAFKERGMLILESMFKAETLNEPPAERNPSVELGFEKSLVYAYFYLTVRDFLTRSSMIQIGLNRKNSEDEIEAELKRVIVPPDKHLANYTTTKVNSYKTKVDEAAPVASRSVRAATESAANKRTKIQPTPKNHGTIRKIRPTSRSS